MREVEWQEDEIPHKVLRCANLVEGDECKCLREERGGEVVFAEGEGEEDAREEHLWEEGGGGPQALWGGGRVLLVLVLVLETR